MEQKIQKNFLVFLAIFMSCGGLLWGWIAIQYGLTQQSIIPLSYVLISFLNITYFKFSKNFVIARTIQILISLILPFLFQYVLGGFFSSGLIMLWSILALMASLSFEKIRMSLFWLGLYLVGITLSAYLEPMARAIKPSILPAFSLEFFVLNVSVVSIIVFALSVYYVYRTKQAHKAVKAQHNQLNDLYGELKQRNTQLRKARKELLVTNEALELSKVKLTDITQKQTEINERLMKRKGYIE
jgi:hypothetical protein